MQLTIDIDDFLDIVMEAWTEQAYEDNKLMKILCENNQLDDDADLNLQEFSQILNVCTEGKIDDRCVLQRGVTSVAYGECGLSCFHMPSLLTFLCTLVGMFSSCSNQPLTMRRPSVACLSETYVGSTALCRRS
jgi:hypothetical protein